MENKETIYRQDVLDLAKKGVLISNGNYESVCKAINELPPVNPQEPKTDGDVISREALLKKCIYTPIAPIIKGNVVHYEDVVFAKDIINAEPIKQEPKTGHWIRHDNGKYHWYLCSCCDAMAGSDEKMMAYKYCPNCGAKMIEPQERSCEPQERSDKE